MDTEGRTGRRAAGPPAHQLGFDALGTPLIDTTFVVLDLETTGLSPTRDRITEVGAVRVRGGEVLGELRTFVHPGRPIPPAVTAITGITDAMVREAPPIDAVLPLVLDLLGDGVLVAHNAGFDLGFLRSAAARLGLSRPEPVVVDTARLARRLLSGEVRDFRLATLAAHLRARTRPEHRALADARATMDVLHGLIERAGSLGATTLEDLRELTRSSSDASFRRIGLVRDAPRTAGVYRFLDARGEVLYVGKATDLRARLRTYFGQDRRRRTADLVRETARVTWTPTATLLEAEVRELREIRATQPRYNRRSKAPDRAVHVALTREAFPRLVITRNPSEGHLDPVGPISSRRRAEALVAAVHEVLALRPCTPRLRVAQDHAPCVLKQLGRCGAPCDGTQSREDYASLVARFRELVDDPDGLLEPLRARMLELAASARFERAGELRTRLHDAAHALAGARDQQALTGLDELVVRRPVDADTELAVVRQGHLVATARVDGAPDDADLAAVVDAITAPDGTRSGGGIPAPPDTEEVALVLAALRQPGVRVVRVTGVWALPVRGGRALTTALVEGRRVARQARHDRQLLERTKVVARRADAG